MSLSSLASMKGGHHCSMDIANLTGLAWFASVGIFMLLRGIRSIDEIRSVRESVAVNLKALDLNKRSVAGWLCK